ncbi:MAG TPA: hypothetical protein VNZ52_11905, partial [Candidatus Thermoplasmatota archaeon]|nr:hypothetical protein [Candidatus Thermoplasmatota archaeon]
PLPPPPCPGCHYDGFVHIPDMNVGESRDLTLYLVFMGNDPNAGVLRNVSFRLGDVYQAKLRMTPEVIVVPEVRPMPLETLGGRPVYISAHDVTITAEATYKLSPAYAWMNAVSSTEDQRFLTSGAMVIVRQGSYEWYYPALVAGAMILLEAVPFIVRSRQVGKRGA